MYTQNPSHLTHHNLKSGYFWVNGLWVAAALSFILQCFNKNIVTFRIRSTDKVHAHTHKTLVRTLSPPEAGRYLKEPVTGLIFGGWHTPGRQAEQQEIRLQCQHSTASEMCLADSRCFKIKLCLGILLGHQKRTKQMEYQSYQVSIYPNYFIFILLLNWYANTVSSPLWRTATFLPSLQKWVHENTKAGKGPHTPSFILVTLKLTCVPPAWGSSMSAVLEEPLNQHIRTWWHQHRNNSKS